MRVCGRGWQVGDHWAHAMERMVERCLGEAACIAAHVPPARRWPNAQSFVRRRMNLVSTAGVSLVDFLGRHVLLRDEGLVLPVHSLGTDGTLNLLAEEGRPGTILVVRPAQVFLVIFSQEPAYVR